jgi:hypothetical protein
MVETFGYEFIRIHVNSSEKGEAVRQGAVEEEAVIDLMDSQCLVAIIT